MFWGWVVLPPPLDADEDVHETKKIQEEKEYLNLIEWETSPGSLLGGGVSDFNIRKRLAPGGGGVDPPTYLLKTDEDVRGACCTDGCAEIKIERKGYVFLSCVGRDIVDRQMAQKRRYSAFSAPFGSPRCRGRHNSKRRTLFYQS